MAGNDYNRGEMSIDEQSRTYAGFMGVTVISSLAVVVGVLFLTLVFAADVGVLLSLVASFILGTIGGVVLKQRIQWYVLMVVMLVLLAIIGVIFRSIG